MRASAAGPTTSPPCYTAAHHYHPDRAAFARDGLLTMTLYDGSGVAMWTTDLEPEPLTSPGLSAPSR